MAGSENPKKKAISPIDSWCSSRCRVASSARMLAVSSLIVLSGTLTFEVGGREGVTFAAPSGSYVVKPRGTAHAFWNTGDEPARYVELSSRDGFERFIDSTTQKGAAQASQDAQRDFDTEFHYDRIPELMLQHRLTHLSSVEVPWEGLMAGSLEEVISKLNAPSA